MASARTARFDEATASQTERALATWREHDLAHALHAHDRAAVRASDAPRALVLEHLARPGSARDLYSACARLGRLLADAGAPPSLLAATLDGAACAFEAVDIAWDAARLAPARASLAEGYVAALREAERIAARGAWDYPACAVTVARDVVAISCGHPAEDREALADWAARVAAAVSRAGYRSAILAGEDAAKAEVTAALSLVGVAIATTAESLGWFASLLKRS